MDTDQLIAHGRARFAHAAARRLLKERYQAKMTFTHAGGMWQAGPALQSLLLTCPDEQAVVLDLYETPLKINVKELLSMSQQHWQEQMTAWLLEYQKLDGRR